MILSSSPWTVGGFHGAVSELMRADAERTAAAKTERARVRHLIQVTDEMIGQLECDNLAGVDRIEPEWCVKLAFLCVSVEPPLIRRVRRVRTPSHALDLIFGIQSRLLKRIMLRPRRRDRRPRHTHSPHVSSTRTEWQSARQGPKDVVSRGWTKLM